jgi:hypothetical protein
MSKKISKTEIDFGLTSTESKKNSLTISKTAKVPRPSKEESSPVTWSIRGVERETRAIIEKAAERAGKTLGKYLNDDVRAFSQSQITNSTSLPSSPKDLQDQITHLTSIVEGIANRLPEEGKKSFWKRIFG